jgi:hypothetical protein
LNKNKIPIRGNRAQFSLLDKPISAKLKIKNEMIKQTTKQHEFLHQIGSEPVYIERVSFCCSCMAVSQCALKELVSAVYA